MKSLMLILTVFTVSLNLYAVNNTDSLFKIAHGKLYDFKERSWVEQLFKEVKALYLEDGKIKRTAYCDGNIARIYEETDRLRMATAQYQSVEDVMIKNNCRDNLNHLYTNWARAYNRIGHYDFAIEMYKKAIKLHPNDSISVARSLNWIGVNYRKLHQYDSSFYYHNKGLGLAISLNDDLEKSYNWANMGLIYFMMGEFDRAIEHFEKAVTIQQIKRDTANLIKNYHLIGHAYLRKGDPKRGTIHFRKVGKLGVTSGEVLSENIELQAQAFELLEVQEVGKEVSNVNVRILLITLLGSVAFAIWPCYHLRLQVINREQKIMNQAAMLFDRNASTGLVKGCVDEAIQELNKDNPDVEEALEELKLVKDLLNVGTVN